MNHISHSNECQIAYPKEEFTKLKLKCKEKGQFLKKIQNQETNTTVKIERKAKEAILNEEKEAKGFEELRTNLESSQRKENKNWFELIQTEFERFKLKNCTDDVSNSLELIQNEAEDLFQKFKQMIDDAVTKTKNSKDRRYIVNMFIGVKPDGLLDFTLRKSWRKFKLEVGKRLAEIAITINETFVITHKEPKMCMWT